MNHSFRHRSSRFLRCFSRFCPFCRVPDWDARVYQIVFLGSFLTIGVLWRDFSLSVWQVLLTFAAAIITQLLCLRITGLSIRHHGVLSAVVTGFGLSLLLRADSLWLHPAMAVLAIASKFTVRYRFRPNHSAHSQHKGNSTTVSDTVHGHLFNPANLGCLVGAYLLDGWLSPGQWGQAIALTAWFIVLGSLVASRAGRWDVALCFLGTYFALYTARTLFLGINPWVILHQAQNGALLLFAFFMISDPVTTPRRAQARWLFGTLVAIAAFLWEISTFRPNGAVLALAALAWLTPLLNRWWPAAGHQWQPVADSTSSSDSDR